jgi:hypothetical protein
MSANRSEDRVSFCSFASSMAAAAAFHAATAHARTQESAQPQSLLWFAS